MRSSCVVQAVTVLSLSASASHVLGLCVNPTTMGATIFILFQEGNIRRKGIFQEKRKKIWGPLTKIFDGNDFILDLSLFVDEHMTDLSIVLSEITWDQTNKHQLFFLIWRSQFPVIFFKFNLKYIQKSGNQKWVFVKHPLREGRQKNVGKMKVEMGKMAQEGSSTEWGGEGEMATQGKAKRSEDVSKSCVGT